MVKTPSPRVLAVVYFLLLGGTGAWVPFLALYLRRGGMDAALLGTVFAALPLLRIFATPAWAWLGDRSGGTVRVIQVASAVSVFAALGTWAHPGLVGLLLSLAIYAVARAPLGPLMDALTIGALEEREGNAARYGQIRAWGSAGFLLFGWIAGWYADEHPDFPIVLTAVLWTVGALVSLVMPAHFRSTPAAVGPALRALLGAPWCRWWLAAAVLQGATLTTYDSFYSLLVDERGFDSVWTGNALITGICLEIALFWAGPTLVGRLGPWRLVRLGMGVAVGRWLLTGWLTDPWALTLVQASHGLAFGAFWAGGVELMRRGAPDHIRGSAQSLFTIAGYGLGPILGGGLATLLLDRVGAAGLFTSCAALSAGALLLTGAAKRAGEAVAALSGR